MKKKNNQTGIYGLLVVAVKKIYVGSALDMITRWEREHLPTLRRNKHYSKELQAAFNQFGEDALQLVIIERVKNTSRLPEREKFWLVYLKNKGVLFNKRVSGTPGMRGKKHSRETRLRMARAKLGSLAGKRVFVSPDGQIYRPEICNELCEQFNLNPGEMSKLARGIVTIHKGWRSV